MALDPPFVVQIETKPGEPGGSFGETMNTVRTWLDHRHIRPVSFLPVATPRSGVGFEISFNSEEEAHLFRAGIRLGPAMHSAQHYRERAARVRTLASSDAELALREQLESMANDYDEIADELEVQETKTRHS